MGGLTRLIVFLSILANITLKSQAQYLLPITKHEPTKQFYTTLDIGHSDAKSQHNLLLDLGTNLTWLNCHKLINLSTLHIVTCESFSCTIIPGNGCNGKNCLYQQPNPIGVQNGDVTGRVVQETTSFSTTDGGKFLSQVSFEPFTFSCASVKDLPGSAPPIDGVLSLSPGGSSFTRQVASAFEVIPKFALCLPSYGTGHFYVAGDYYIIPPFDNSTNLIPKTLTPLRSVAGNNTGDYLITVQSIYVEGDPLSLNPNLLLRGVGAKLSTVAPYTTLQADIYSALAQSFTSKAEEMGIAKVSSDAPFKDCFDASTAAGKDMTGPNMPVIEFGLPGREGEVKWSFHGANTVVKVTETVMCLAFYDGGKTPNEMVVFGTHQLQDYMLEFDLSTTIFSFSESLLLHDTSCSTWPSQK